MASPTAFLAEVRQLRRAKLEGQQLRAARRQQRRERSTERHETILDLMGRVSPHLRRPQHFARYCGELERAVGGGLRIVFSAPPQHGKTECTLHGLVWLIKEHTGRRHAYVTYSQKRARSVSKKVRRILAATGVVVGGTLDQIELPNGGQILFTSVDGGITGEPVDGVALLDDLFKNRKEADSASRRAVVLDAYREAIETRVHPGASIMLLATRWHPEDLSGTLISEGWACINLPAIAEENDANGREIGEALFPEMWPLEALERKRVNVGDFAWAALYQGRPRPRGGLVFREPTYYRKLPEIYSGAYGVDLAYTERTSADWSICVAMLREETADPERPRFYVLHVDRQQVEAPRFTLTLKARHIQRPSWPMLWRASGTEKGAAKFIQRQLPLRVKQPPGDKLVSSTEAAAAWNDGRVLVPDPEVFEHQAGFEGLSEWLYPFLDVVMNFTGMGNEVDDDVDALGNAHAALLFDDGTAAVVGGRKDFDYDDD